MKTEKLTKKDMLPTKFEPERSNRFVVTFKDGDKTPLDAFTVRSYQTAPFKKSFWSKKIVLENNGLIVTRHYSPIAPSVTQCAWDLLQTQKKIMIEVKLLDPVGTVVQHQKFMGCKLKNFTISDLNYDPTPPDQLIMIDLYFTCDHVDLEY